jgi:torulene dioxygenase
MSIPNFKALGFQNAPEVIEPVQLPIQGALPSWLSGALYRTGPGTFRVKKHRRCGYFDINHWFDGLGMHHKFEIRENGTQVWYNCRKSSEHMEKRIAREGKNPFNTFNQLPDPCDSRFKKFFTFFAALTGSGPQPTTKADEFNVSVTLEPNMALLKPSSHTNLKNRQGISHIVAKTDSTKLQVIDPDTLEPLDHQRYGNIDPRLQGHMSAAHGCTDKRTGDFFNFVLKMGPTSCYTVFCVRGGLIDEKQEGRVDILATITDAPAAYLHSSFMTEKYVILAVWQADFV